MDISQPNHLAALWYPPRPLAGHTTGKSCARSHTDDTDARACEVKILVCCELLGQMALAEKFDIHKWLPLQLLQSLHLTLYGESGPNDANWRIK